MAGFRGAGGGRLRRSTVPAGVSRRIPRARRRFRRCGRRVRSPSTGGPWATPLPAEVPSSGRVCSGPAVGGGARTARPAAGERRRQCDRVLRAGDGARSARNSPGPVENCRNRSEQSRGIGRDRRLSGSSVVVGGRSGPPRGPAVSGSRSRPSGYAECCAPGWRAGRASPRVEHGEERPVNGLLDRRKGGRPVPEFRFVQLLGVCAVPRAAGTRLSTPHGSDATGPNGPGRGMAMPGARRAASGRSRAIVGVPGRPSCRIAPRNVAPWVNGVAIRPYRPVPARRLLRVTESRAARPG